MRDQLDKLQKMVEGLLKRTETNAHQRRVAANEALSTADISPDELGNMEDGASSVGDFQSERATRRNYSVRDIAETVPEFDPTSELSLTATQFIARIESAQQAYEWDDKCLMLAVFRQMKGASRLWLDANIGAVATLSDFKSAFIDEVVLEMDEADISLKMYNATRRADEKVLEYGFRMSAMGRRYGLSEQAVIKYTREGLKYRELQTAVAALKFTTFGYYNGTFNFAENTVYEHPPFKTRIRNI